MNIRLAKINDLKDIYDLICDMESTQLDYKKFEQIFIRYLENENFYSIVAEEDDLIIACLNLRIEYQLHHVEKIAEIMELAVKKEYRSKSVGKILLDKARKISKDNNCLQMEVCCNQIREKAHKFYQREGMKNSHFKFSMELN
ncbi:GNAT family N-acetyltransferase [Arcobacter sp. F2176]|uniref:GNAT family N-acetyltransferase n=1 Tax=Arcobacter sp. F2176 TaxID=2044511 RepID=UPI00100BE3D3|nr:GNAT family N-acetyltransferase [Arcobacter sp. F2176]RXJ82788.1 GNAT family N-acetyltransferase [Arcobacter sp. F2176]